MLRFGFRASLALSTAVLGVARSAAGAQTFEGAITMQISGLGANGAPQEVEFLTRGARGVRVNANGPMGAMAMISMPAEHKLYLMIDAQSAYVELPSNVDSMVGGRLDIAEPKITRTKKMETIAGYECEHILVQTEKDVTDVCMARGLGPFLNVLNGLRLGGNRAPAWQRSLAADGGFPLKVSAADGKVALEVKKIEKRKLSSALFVIPASYTKMDVPGRRP